MCRERRSFLSDRQVQYYDHCGGREMDSLCPLMLELRSLSQGSIQEGSGEAGAEVVRLPSVGAGGRLWK